MRAVILCFMAQVFYSVQLSIESDEIIGLSDWNKQLMIYIFAIYYNEYSLN